MSKKTLFTIGFTIFLCSISLSQKLLQYNLKAGDSMSVFQHANQDITQEINETKHNIKNVMDSQYGFLVKTITDSSYIIHFKFDRFKWVMTSSIYGEMMHIDTDIKSEEAEYKIFLGLTKSVLVMEMLKNGRILSITGTKKMIDNMVNEAGITDAFTKQLMIESMEKEFGSQNLSNSFQQLTYIYPKHKVIAGQSWKNTYTGILECDNTWTLDNIDKTINLSGKSLVHMNSGDASQTITASGEQQTHIKSDLTTFFPKSMTVSSQMKGTTVMDQMNTIDIPTTITSTTTYKTQKHVQ